MYPGNVPQPWLNGPAIYSQIALAEDIPFQRKPTVLLKDSQRADESLAAKVAQRTPERALVINRLTRGVL